MAPETVAELAAMVFMVALLYASVGHGGASGYLAAMALLDFSPSVMKPTALCLNIVVAAIAAYQFHCHFSGRLFWPFAASSVPAAFIGGAITLPGFSYRLLAGSVLICAAGRLLLKSEEILPEATKRPSIPRCLVAGGGMGLLAGLTGIGGGIFLSPLLLLMKWAKTKQSSAVSAAFILANSLSGLAGSFATGALQLSKSILFWAAAALVGGWIGSHYGSHRLLARTLRRLLAAVLVVAALKLIAIS